MPEMNCCSHKMNDKQKNIFNFMIQTLVPGKNFYFEYCLYLKSRLKSIGDFLAICRCAILENTAKLLLLSMQKITDYFIAQNQNRHRRRSIEWYFQDFYPGRVSNSRPRLQRFDQFHSLKSEPDFLSAENFEIMVKIKLNK